MPDARWTFWLDQCPCCGDSLEIHTTASINAVTNEQEDCFDGDDLRCVATDGRCKWTGSIMVYDVGPEYGITDGVECGCFDD